MKALCLLVSFIVTSNAVDITPWETEADTVWTEAMLRPKPAEDRKGMQEECARRIGLLDLRSNKLIPVTEAVPAAIENSSLTKKGYYGYVFIVANGANEGTWLSWHPGCLGTLARVAATRIASPSRSHRRKLFLYNIAGRPIYDNEDGTGETAATTDTGHGMGRSLRLLQLLVEGEAWMWGGVAPGFSFRIGRPATLGSTNTAASSIQLRTLALSPRVLQVVNVLNEDTMQGILDSGERLGMRRSPEKHYDNSGRFANYRTSKSSFLTGQHPSHNVVRGTCQVVARLAERSYVEWPQLLRYDPGDWYKTHRDTFHDFKHPNRRRLIDAKNQGSPGPFQLWTKWIRRVLDNEGQMPKPRQESDGGSVTAVTAITWIQEVLDGISLNPPPASDQNIFELELAGMLLKDAEASATLGEKWLPWLKDNHARRSVGLISTLLGEGQYSKTGGRPELLHFVHRCWVEAVKAQVVEFLEEKDLEEPLDPDALVDAAGISWYDAGAAGADEENSQNEEDILGPPWVEPNRHCTVSSCMTRAPSLTNYVQANVW